jgi:hypothetical protein
MIVDTKQTSSKWMHIVVGSLLVIHYCCDATKIFTNNFA